MLGVSEHRSKKCATFSISKLTRNPSQTVFTHSLFNEEKMCSMQSLFCDCHSGDGLHTLLLSACIYSLFFSQRTNLPIAATKQLDCVDQNCLMLCVFSSHSVYGSHAFKLWVIPVVSLLLHTPLWTHEL